MIVTAAAGKCNDGTPLPFLAVSTVFAYEKDMFPAAGRDFIRADFIERRMPLLRNFWMYGGNIILTLNYDFAGADRAATLGTTSRSDSWSPFSIAAITAHGADKCCTLIASGGNI